MATHEVDRKILGRLAVAAQPVDGALSGALWQILGLSKMLSRRLVRARKLRRLSMSDEKAMVLYHHIIWMSREGLSIVETIITPLSETNQFGPELKIFAYKLRASFYHVFCLFHNKPSVSPLNPTGGPETGEQAPTVLLPIPGNRQIRLGSTPPRKDSKSQDSKEPSPPDKRGLRDSMISDTSNVTNPFGSISALSPPPGLPGNSSKIPDPAAFLLPSTNFIPLTIASFDSAEALARKQLSGSSPLLLSIALEYSAFKWDCLHDHKASRDHARNTIKGVYAAQEGMDDHEFEDAATLVGTLGRMMKRKSEEQTPRFGLPTPTQAPAGPSLPGTESVSAMTALPPVPQITVADQEALRAEAEREQEAARRASEEDQKTVTPPRSVAASSAATLTPPRPTTSGTTGSRGTAELNKPLPQLPQVEPGFAIPRRPVGTPPGINTRSRERAENPYQQPSDMPAPLNIRTPNATGGQASQSSGPSRPTGLRSPSQTAARSPTQGGRVTKRSGNGNGNGNIGAASGRSMLPRPRMKYG